jgi:hypothetical protein
MPIRSSEIYRGQRGKEKRALFQHFQLRVIKDVYRAQFFKLFEDKCFKCSKPEKPEPEFSKPPVLCIDHHIPMARGGHLVPGNLVSLCRDCNHRKLDRSPDAFYTAQELARLQPLLDAQQNLFTFVFDGERWMTDPEEYLLELGVPAKIVDAALNDETYLHYVGHPTTNSLLTIEIDMDFLIKSFNVAVNQRSTANQKLSAEEPTQRGAADT